MNGEPGSDPSRTPRATLAGTIILASLANGALAASRLIVPILSISMGASVLLLGITVALFAAIPMFFSVSFGRWVDRKGTFKPLIFSASLIVIGAAAPIVFPSAYSLLLTAVLVGSGAVFTHVVATRAVGELRPRAHRDRNLGKLIMTYSVTQFLGPTVTGSTYEHFGMSSAVAIIGFLGMAIIAGLFLIDHNYRVRADFSSGPPVKLRLYDLMAIRALRKWVIISSIFMGVITNLPFAVAMHTVEIGLSVTSAGFILGAFSVGMFVARLTASHAGRYVTPQKAALLSLIFGGCAYASIPFTEHFATFAASAAMIGLTLGMGGPLTLGLIYGAAPPTRVNEAIGLSLAMSNFLQAALPLMIGVGAAYLGMAPMVWILAAGMLLAGLVSIVSERPNNR